MVRGGFICCVLAEARQRCCCAVFLLVSLPVYSTMPQMHCERPCVLVQGPQICCWVLNSGKISLQPFSQIIATLLKTRFLTRTIRTCCCCTSGTFNLCPSYDYERDGNGGCLLFPNLSADNWIKSGTKPTEGKRRESLRVNIIAESCSA